MISHVEYYLKLPMYWLGTGAQWNMTVSISSDVPISEYTYSSFIATNSIIVLANDILVLIKLQLSVYIYIKL